MYGPLQSCKRKMSDDSWSAPMYSALRGVVDNKIAFLSLPWAQEAPGSNPGAPSTSDFFRLQSDSKSARVHQF